MAVPISCSACGATYRIPSSLFATRFAGKDTTIKCKRCTAAIIVRGNLGDAALADVSTDPPPGESAVSLPPLDGSERPPPSEVGASASELIDSLSSQPPPISEGGRSRDAPDGHPPSATQPPPSVRRSSRPAASRPWVGLRSLSIPRSTIPPSSERLVNGSATEGRPLAVSAEARAERSAPEFEERAPPESGPRADVREPHSSVPPPVAPLLRMSAASLRGAGVATPGEEEPAAAPKPAAGSSPNATKSPRPVVRADGGKPTASATERPAAQPAERSSSAAWWILAAALAAAVLWYALGRTGDSPAAPQPRSEHTPAQPLSPGASDSTGTDDPSGASRGADNVDGELPTTLAAEPGTATYDRQRLEQVLATGLKQASECDEGESTTGSVRITLSFGPSGRVSAAKLEGEPMASAPISQCILSHLRSLAIPPFQGRAFEVSRELTLP